MPDPVWIVGALAVVVVAILAFASRRAAARGRAVGRLGDDEPGLDALASGDESPRRAIRVVGSPARVVPIAIGVVAAVVVWVAMHHLAIAAAAGVVVGTIAWTAQDTIVASRWLRLEQQLADLIDLVVGTLRAGIGVVEGLESAARESKEPLRGLIEDTTARIRLGDDPQRVFVDLRARVPAESFRLFAFALAVHWQAGGSLAPTLASVGRSVRDRIDLARRARAQAAEAQFSVVGILLLIYVLGFLMWRLEPERLEQFVAWEPGAALVTAVAALQAVGLLWMRKLARVEF